MKNPKTLRNPKKVRKSRKTNIILGYVSSDLRNERGHSEIGRTNELKTSSKWLRRDLKESREAGQGHKARMERAW